MDRLQIVYKNISDLKMYENNPRDNDEAVEYVANSIREFGWKVPVVIDKDDVIVAGHTRVKAAITLGIDDIPCIIADDLDDRQIKAFRLADNKTGEKAEWNYEKLAQELEGLLDFDMEQFGFEELEDALAEELDNPYSMNTNIPQYNPTGYMPSFDEMVDTEKADELIKEIDEADIPEDIKRFLRLGAYRHIVYNYKNIAEYYANSDKQVQELMEKSALVIIDIGDAMKNGYVGMVEQIESLLGDDDE